MPNSIDNIELVQALLIKMINRRGAHPIELEEAVQLLEEAKNEINEWKKQNIG